MSIKSIQISDLNHDPVKVTVWSVGEIMTMDASNSLIDSTDLSAAKSCIQFGDTVTIGKVIVEPIF